VYQVSAVITDIPVNTHLKFAALLSHSTLKEINPWYKETEWMGNNEYTYLLMSPGVNLSDFNKKLSSLSTSLKDKIGTNKYVAEPIQEIHLYSNKTYEPEVNGNAKVVYFLLVIAVFIIVIAWVNYVNLSTARAMERAREVGIRKVMGSVKAQLVLQFLSESVTVNILAGLLALILFQVTLPVFHELTGQPMVINFMNDYSFWKLFFGLLVIGSLLSGLYPAFVLSSFQPVAVLKGKFQSSLHGQKLRQSLVVFQFGATVVLMVSMCIVYLQINYLRNYDLGMNLNQTLAIRVPQIDVADSILRTTSKSLKTELLRNKNVEVVSRAGSLPGLSLHELSSTSFTRVGREKLDGQYEYYHFSIDADFIAALGMKLISGRNFKEGMPNQDQVIINEEAMHRLGFATPEDAIGAKITYQTRWPGEPATIIGVLHNFYQRSPKEKHIPMLFKYNEDTDYFALRLKTDNIKETMAAVKATWSRVYPNSVFHYFFLDEKYAQQYEADVQFGKVIATFSALAVFIACLGLFGLSSYTIVQRTKEIGIRKVLGASVGQIVRLLSEDFAKVIMIASLLALPIAYFAMSEWLSNYDARVSMPAWVFIVPVMLIVFVALLTVSFQTIRTALSNPADSLKQE
jgi:putative ABC transport system permease protein